MWKRISSWLGLLSAAIMLTTMPVEAAYTIWRGSIIDSDDIPTFSIDTHYAIAYEAFECGEWREAAKHFRIVSIHGNDFEYASDSRYFEGVALFEAQEYDRANEAFSCYLKSCGNPQYLQDAVIYKYWIAEKFRCGARKHMFGTKYLPCWATAYEEAVEIYDQVVCALPNHEIAAFALDAKARMLWVIRDYRGAIESYQTIIRRFPKHELAPESYLAISRVYYSQACYEFQNPDILAFAQLNLRKFTADFPQDERVCLAEEITQGIKELYATGLYNTGLFYKRICEPNAAAIYFYHTIDRFPDTCTAQKAYCHLDRLGYPADLAAPGEKESKESKVGEDFQLNDGAEADDGEENYNFS